MSYSPWDHKESDVTEHIYKHPCVRDASARGMPERKPWKRDAGESEWLLTLINKE